MESEQAGRSPNIGSDLGGFFPIAAVDKGMDFKAVL